MTDDEVKEKLSAMRERAERLAERLGSFLVAEACNEEPEDWTLTIDFRASPIRHGKRWRVARRRYAREQKRGPLNNKRVNGLHDLCSDIARFDLLKAAVPSRPGLDRMRALARCDILARKLSKKWGPVT